MKRYLFIIIATLMTAVSCKNENYNYPSDVKGRWDTMYEEEQTVEKKGWLYFEKDSAIVHVKIDTFFVYMKNCYVYMPQRGSGVIAIEDESKNMAALEFEIDPEDGYMVATGLDKDLQVIEYLLLERKTTDADSTIIEP